MCASGWRTRPSVRCAPTSSGCRPRGSSSSARAPRWRPSTTDRKSTRLNSSHGYISYAVFCLKKKNRLQPRLLDYVRQGGRLVIQYQTPDAALDDKLGPYPFKVSRDRVTVEEAEVRFEDASDP